MAIDDLRAPYDAYYVSNGRLVVEMVTGRQQIGIKPDRFAERAPAQVTLGDRDDPTGPTLGATPGRSVRGAAAVPPASGTILGEIPASERGSRECMAR